MSSVANDNVCHRVAASDRGKLSQLALKETMFGGGKGNKPLLGPSSFASYPAIETGQTFGLAVFWLFVMFAESQIKAFERGPEYYKNCNGCETLFLRIL